MKICTIEGCGTRAIKRGWCNKHYLRFRRYGHPLAGGRPRPTCGGPSVDHPLYETWLQMIGRCTKPNNKRYKYYGARGIKVCQRWLDSFDSFCEDLGERPAKTTLDRIDVNGDYEPENCRWANQSQQCLNQRPKRTGPMMHKGVTLREERKSPWQVQFRGKGVGSFADYSDAVEAWHQAMLAYGEIVPCCDLSPLLPA